MLQPLIHECLSKGPIQNLNTKSVIENIKYFLVSSHFAYFGILQYSSIHDRPYLRKRAAQHHLKIASFWWDSKNNYYTLEKSNFGRLNEE